MKYVLLILTIISLKSAAQSTEEEVKKPITLLFDGMRKGDSGLMRSVFAPNAVLQTIARTKDGTATVRTDDLDKFMDFVAQPHKDIYDERITFDLIRIDADLAVVWTPYKFYLGDQFSHCGVNSFQLVRLNGTWKIQYIIDTRRKDNCL